MTQWDSSPEELERRPSKNKRPCQGCDRMFSKAKLWAGYCNECRELWNDMEYDKEMRADVRCWHAEEAMRLAAFQRVSHDRELSDARDKVEHLREECARVEAQLERQTKELMEKTKELGTQKAQFELALKWLKKDRERVIVRVREEKEELEKNTKREIDELMAERAELRAMLEDAREAAQCRRTDYGQWQYEKSNEDWRDMLETTCYDLDKRYKAYRKSKIDEPVRLNIDDRWYLVDFREMTQVNVSSQRICRIRVRIARRGHWKRELTYDDYLSRNWGGVSQVLPIHTASTVLSVLKTHTWCGGSCPGKDSKVVNAWQVENWPLWTAYQAKLRSMRMEYDRLELKPAKIMPPIPLVLAQPWLENVPGLEKLDGFLNEFYLFHGTRTKTGMQQIVEKGFDCRLASQKQDPSGLWFCPRGYYGQGTYFATEICKSMQYMRDEGGRFLIVARVVLGDVHYTKKVCRELKRPPENSRCAELQFDAVVANVGPMKGHDQKYQAHREFVIFDNAQAYPEFVIEFEQ